MNLLKLLETPAGEFAMPFAARFAVLPDPIEDEIIGHYDAEAQVWVYPDSAGKSAYEMKGTPTRSSTTLMTIDSDNDDS